MKTRRKGLWKVYAIVFVTLIVMQSLAGVNTVFADVTTLHCLNVWTSDNMTVYNYADGSTANAVSDGIVQIDTSCSFLCQVIQVNGEDAGLEFVQQ